MRVGFFVKTDYKKLIDNICENNDVTGQKEDLETLTDLIMPAMLGYVKAVCDLEYQLPILKKMYTGKEYQEIFQTLDSKRSSAHENLISNIRKLNRLAQIYDMNPIFRETKTTDMKLLASR